MLLSHPGRPGPTPNRGIDGSCCHRSMPTPGIGRGVPGALVTSRPARAHAEPGNKWELLSHGGRGGAANGPGPRRTGSRPQKGFPLERIRTEGAGHEVASQCRPVMLFWWGFPLLKCDKSAGHASTYSRGPGPCRVGRGMAERSCDIHADPGNR